MSPVKRPGVCRAFVYEGGKSMEFTVRRARLDDYKALARLNREEMGYDYPKEKRGTA